MSSIRWVAALWAVCAVVLGGLAPAAAQPPEKLTDVEHIRSWKELGGIGLLHKRVGLSTNFAIYYRTDQVPEAFVNEIGGLLEYALDRLTAGFGYPLPASFHTYRIPVYLKADVEGGALGAMNPRNYGFLAIYGYLPVLEFPSHLRDGKLKASVAHELFHLVQHAYVDRLTRDGHWLREATSTWVEDEVFPEPDPAIGYPLYASTWYEHWQDPANPSLFGPADLRVLPQFVYGSGIFFKYLSEHHPRGRDIVRRVWDIYRTMPGDQAVPALRFSLGGARAFREHFTRFCAAAHLKEVPPYDLRRAREFPETIVPVPLRGTNEWYYPDGPAPGSGWMPVAKPRTEQNPLSATYYEIIPPVWLRDGAPLYLTLEHPRNGPLAFALVSRFSDGANSRVDVETIVEMPANKTIVRTIHNFGPPSGHVTRVIVVAANASAESRFPTFGISYAVSDPPYLREVRVADKAKVIYHARWQDTSGVRTLSIVRDLPVLSEGRAGVGELELELKFSEAMTATPTVTVGGVGVPLTAPGSPETWQGTIRSLPAHPDGDRVPIVVQGTDQSGTPLDADPATIASYDETWGRRWMAFESRAGGEDTHLGGPDATHAMTLRREPPRVTRVRFASRRVVFYDAELRELEGRAARGWHRHRDVALDLGQVQGGTVEVTFSHPVDDVSVAAGAQPGQVRPYRDARVFRAGVSLAGAVPGDPLPITIEWVDPATPGVRARDARHVVQTEQARPRLPDAYYNIYAFCYRDTVGDHVGRITLRFQRDAATGRHRPVAYVPNCRLFETTEAFRQVDLARPEYTTYLYQPWESPEQSLNLLFLDFAFERGTLRAEIDDFSNSGRTVELRMDAEGNFAGRCVGSYLRKYKMTGDDQWALTHWRSRDVKGVEYWLLIHEGADRLWGGGTKRYRDSTEIQRALLNGVRALE